MMTNDGTATVEHGDRFEDRPSGRLYLRAAGSGWEAVAGACDSSYEWGWEMGHRDALEGLDPLPRACVPAGYRDGYVDGHGDTVGFER
jgi:hypothetical protein